MRSAIFTGLRVLTATLVAFMILSALLVVTAAAAFPMGGGEYHAIFAYSEGGRIGAALQVFGTYASALGLGSMVLIVCRFPLPWQGVACIASAVGEVTWLRIYQGPMQSMPFRVVTFAGFVVMPIVIFALSRGAWRFQRERRLE